MSAPGLGRLTGRAGEGKSIDALLPRFFPPQDLPPIPIAYLIPRYLGMKAGSIASR